MTTSPNRISTELTSGKIKVINDIDLNSLFNLNYNFDLLKGLIETLIKNQELLQNQIDENSTINSKKDKKIEQIEKQQSLMLNSFIDKITFAKLKNEIDDINDHLNNNDTQLEECKKKIIFNIIFFN